MFSVIYVCRLVNKLYFLFSIYVYFKGDDDDDDEDEDEDDGDEDYVDVDGDEKNDCICGGCTKDIADIPPKCCNQNPCLSSVAEGRFFRSFYLFVYFTYINI